MVHLILCLKKYSTRPCAVPIKTVMKEQKNWESYFQDAILSVEELLSKHNAQGGQYSKLKIALDNRFITWFEYKEWAKDFYGVPALNIDRPETLNHLKNLYLKNSTKIGSSEIWSNDMIALDLWDQQIIVLGIEPSAKLNQLNNHIFILTPPEIIDQIISTSNTTNLTVENADHKTSPLEILISNSDVSNSQASIDPFQELEILDQKQIIELSGPDNIDLSTLNVEQVDLNNHDDAIQIDSSSDQIKSLDQVNPDILSFDDMSAPVKLGPLEIKQDQATPPHDLAENKTVVTSQNAQETNPDSEKEEAVSLFKNMKEQTPTVTDRIWNNLAAHHDDYAIAVRKQFDAYLVLRITADETTEVYKMDEDLAKEEINFNVFKYDLKKANPFQNVYKKHFTETFNVNQLGLTILDFKYACVSVIKLGPKVVGFLVGFKTTHLSQEDISTLESISEKVV